MVFKVDKNFVDLWNLHRSPKKIAAVLKMDVRQVYRYRNMAEKEFNIILSSDKRNLSERIKESEGKNALFLSQTRLNVRRNIEIDSGCIIVFSDAHFYPNDETTAYRALLELIKELKPKAIINNGDAFDGTTISRHPRIGWAKAPSVIEELEAVKFHLGEIETAATMKSKLYWALGNHDARFETFLSAQVPQFQNVDGFQLKDHFPSWLPCWSVWINGETVVKHRWKGGFGAGRANTLNAGTNFITGHTHNLAVQPLTDYNGTRYGVQTGTLADPKGDQFIDYTEDNPVDWRSGFAVLSFYEGKLLMPELCQVFNEQEGLVQFRGKILRV